MRTILKTIFLAALLTVSASGHVVSARSGGEPPPRTKLPVEFEHITIEDGLSNNMVRSIIQDDKGFMWFGTFDGLNRYDGHEFRIWRHDPDDPGSLSGNPVRVLYEDRAGNIWVGTWGSGLNMFDRETETFVRYRHDPDDPHSLSHDGVYSIFEDRSGTLWVGTYDGGLNRLDRETGKFTHYRHDPDNPASIGHDAVYPIYEDRTGVLWIGTMGGGLNRFDRETGTFLRYRHDPDNPRSLSHDKVRAILEDRAGALWIGTMGGGISLFDRDTETFRHYRHNPADPDSLGDNNVGAIMEDRTGALWIATGGGIDLFDRDTETFAHHTHNPALPGSLNHNFVYWLCEDSSGLIWIGTEGGGINLFDPEKKMFRNYRSNPAIPPGLSFNDVWGISEDPSGGLWVATNGGGLNRSDRDRETWTHYLNDPARPESLSSDITYTILTDQAGTLWTGTFGGGLNRFDPGTETFIRYRHDPADPQSLSDDMVMSLHEDRSGTLWIATWNGGLNRFDRETRSFSHYRHNPADPDTLGSNTLTSVYEDRAGTLWVGTMHSGLSRFDRSTGTFRHYRHDPDDPVSLSNNTVSFTYEDRAGRFWVGTGGGINRFDRENERFIRFTKRDGLPGDSMYGILEDRQGLLWISTGHGLSKFSPDTETFRNYDVNDGIQGNQFNFGSSYKSGGGEMFFGGTNGFTAFYPEHIRDNPHIPPVVITKFLLASRPVPVGGDSILRKSVLETEHLTLSYLDRVFSFEFAALNYRTPEKNRYRYKMAGFEEEWTEADSTRRFATYTNLDPGEYVFRVIGSNNDGVWNEEGDSVRITVTPPWWETIWFRGFVLIFVTGLIFGGFHWRMRTIESQKRQLATQVEERTQDLKEEKEKAEILREKAEAANHAKSEFLANMSHELRTPLNAILGFAQIMTRSRMADPEQRENLAVISRSGEHLLTLINQVLDLSKIEAGRVSLEERNFDLHDMLSELEDMFRMQADRKGLQLVFICAEDVPRHIRTDEVRLRQVLINLLNNALKFTRKGGVTVKTGIAYSEDRESGNLNLEFEIGDTGPGIASEELDMLFEAFVQTKSGRRAREGTGLGLAISRKFVRLMDGDITVRGEPGHGTTFTFHIQAGIAELAETGPLPTARRAIALEPGQPRHRILIADDNQDNRRLLFRLLSPFGFDLGEAVNGQEAVETWERLRPHLIWMDIRMPLMSGYEAATRIRDEEVGMGNEEPGIRHTAIIAISASVYEEEHDVAISEGCDDFLRKPFREADIFDLMTRHAGIRFVYEDEDEDDRKTESGTLNAESRQVLTPESLAVLPDDVSAKFRRAADIADFETAKRLTEQIRSENESLADALGELVNDFRFDILQKLFEKGR